MSKKFFFVLIHVLLFSCKVFGASLHSPFADPVIVSDVSFVNLGTYRGFTDNGSEYKKTYLMSRYMNNTWGEARAICKSFDLELMTLETLQEANSFLTMVDNHSYFRTTGGVCSSIDATTLTSKSPTDWYWSQTGKKISFPIPWEVNQPGGAPEFCLGICRASSTIKFSYHDLSCDTHVYKFVCQRFDIFIP